MRDQLPSHFKALESYLMNILDSSVKNIQYINSPICKKAAFATSQTLFLILLFLFDYSIYLFYLNFQPEIALKASQAGN